ncbi:hypothetical protein CRG98_018100 [Punica granatum]|uniref:Uncharacterized protein n=1 Tax=Punica granatum TaxID=22663 RepID=A0A2I0K1D0_PUNGR|nr:hypothetical protein CRG98_018100 [Punica granatum]
MAGRAILIKLAIQSISSYTMQVVSLPRGICAEIDKLCRKSHFQNVIARVRNWLNGWSASSLSMAGRAILIKLAIQSISSYTMQVVSLPRGICAEIDKLCRKSHFQNVIARVRNWLNGWSASSLSMAGRAILIKLAIQSISSYTMQVVSLPRGICAEIDKLCQNFLREHKEDQKKLHMLGGIGHGLAVMGGLSNTILAGSFGPRLWAVARTGCLRPISYNPTRAGCKFCDIVWRLGLASNTNLFEPHIAAPLSECVAAVLEYEWQ